MKDIDKMLKCRAVFLYNIGLIYQDFNLLGDERLYVLLEGFLENYLESFPKSFNLIYYFKVDKEGNLSVYEDEKWTNILAKYLRYFALHDNKNITKMYDEIGQRNINKITQLVSLFYSYVMAINDMDNARVRS